MERAGRQTDRLRLYRTGTARGVFDASLSRPAPGQYHAWIAAPALDGKVPAVDFQVAVPAGELAQVRMDADAMRRAAEETGGRFYGFGSADRLLHDLPPGRQTLVAALPPRPLWNTWPVLALFLALLIAEWILRKRQGMV